MIINTKKYIEEFLKIRTKSSEILPFKLNVPQMKLYNAIKRQAEADKPQRIIVLKARQMGFSTLTEAIIFKKTATAFNVSSAIVTQKDEATTNLFDMSKRYYKHLPDEIKPQLKASNAKELIFDTREGEGFNSRIKCFTAGGEAIGRSDTLQNLHVSEYAFWTGEKKLTLNGLLQAVPNDPNTLVIIESTANGYDHFKELWDMAVSGENDFEPVFCAWWEMPEYRMTYSGEAMSEEEFELKELYGLDDEQIMWRRWCIANNCGGDKNLFKQEYPANPHEAFLSSGECLFDKDAIIKQIERIRPLIGGQRRGEFEYRKRVFPVKNNKGEVVAVEKEIDEIIFVERENGLIVIHEEPKAEDKKNGELWKEPYAVGGDTSGLGTDFYTAKAISVMDGRTVATLRKQRIDEDKYADQIYCLGKYYHDALVGIETNYSRVPTRELEELKYPNLYIRERLDTSTREITKISGFETTGTTKPIVISNLVTLMRESPENEQDIDTLKEMLVFVRKENGRQEAQQGYHDDLVMAKAIANFIASQQGDPNWIKTVPQGKTMSKIEKFFAEEYDNDEPEERRYVEW